MAECHKGMARQIRNATLTLVDRETPAYDGTRLSFHGLGGRGDATGGSHEKPPTPLGQPPTRRGPALILWAESRSRIGARSPAPA
jgi:hypothetical protein